MGVASDVVVLANRQGAAQPRRDQISGSLSRQEKIQPAEYCCSNEQYHPIAQATSGNLYMLRPVIIYLPIANDYLGVLARKLLTRHQG